MPDIQFIGDQKVVGGAEEVTIDNQSAPEPEVQSDKRFPDACIPLSDEQEKRLRDWVSTWLLALKSSHNDKVTEWAAQEAAYRAISPGPLNTPYVGACGDIVPVIAMAVDPIHARLDTGIFKAKPVFKLTGLKKSVLKYMNAVEQWIEYYQKNRLKLRSVASPRILECTKHGTMIYKTVYEHETYKIKGYNKKWEVIDKEVVAFSGPKVYGISIQDLLFPPGYQHLNDCPFVAERIRTTRGLLKIAEASGKLKDVDRVKDEATNQKDELRTERELSANHQDPGHTTGDTIEIWEIWCDFILDEEEGIPERLCITYHEGTGAFLQVRYNWYFHQRKPYTVIPYQLTNDSLYGLGICEMSIFFQDAQTKWHRMATDNAYLANIRMFIAKKDSGIEEVPKLYTGRTFFVDNPQTDFVPFAAAEVYASTLQERQNLFGLTEKRTGISDYLTGRESPIVGSRATATSTVALIQEGTRRVEEVLENIRAGYSEIMQMCMYIWVQYGLDGIDDVVFGDDEVGQLVKDFFDTATQDNISGMLAIDLSATDASNNKAVQQQVQLAIIQVMMQYLDKLVQAGQLALSAAASQPALTQLIGAVMESARKMFMDLLSKHDIRNPEDYLPDLEVYLNSAITQGQGQAGGSPTPNGGAASASGVPSGSGSPGNPTAEFAARAGVGDPNAPITSATG